jgi:8-oxo-dGTP pyrophosphatase MutT (NUDIX family)
MASRSQKLRSQVAALPYRVDGEGRVSVLLVTSRETRRWVVPKGWPMKKRSAAEAAEIEAFEEAGVRGAIGKRRIGSYTYPKRFDSGTTVDCRVDVFPLRVKTELPEWPEQEERNTAWFTPESAASAVMEPELSALILSFGREAPEKKAG